MISKLKGRRSPVPAIVLLIVALIAIIYSEYFSPTGGFITAGAAGSAGLGIGHMIAIICLLGAAFMTFPRKK